MQVLDAAERALIAIAADGSALLDPELDIFAAVAEEQPLFAMWRDRVANMEVKAADGTKHKVFAAALDEARNPSQQAPPLHVQCGFK
jgi:hypothetical protein